MADYWGRLFNQDRSPTDLLQDLLFGIAKHIKDAVEPVEEKRLTPEKLARFYREIEGNSDELFLDMPHKALGYIYRALQCRHGLQQPANDDTAAPTIPYLEPSGFARWQIIQLLLDPDENSRILGRCMNKFEITNPATGQLFPRMLPRSSFPSHPDGEMTKWHEEVYDGLQKGSLEERRRSSPSVSPPSTSRSRPPSPISHLHRQEDYSRKKTPQRSQRYSPPIIEVFSSGDGKPRRVSPLRRGKTMRSRSEDRTPHTVPEEDRQYRPESYYMSEPPRNRRHSSVMSSTTWSSSSSDTDASDASSQSQRKTRPSLYRPQTEQPRPSGGFNAGSRITSAPLLSRWWQRAQGSRPHFSNPTYDKPTPASYRSPSYTNRYQPPAAPSPPPAQPQSAPPFRPKYYHRTSSNSTARASSTPRAASPPSQSRPTTTRYRSHSGDRPRPLRRETDTERDRARDFARGEYFDPRTRPANVPAAAPDFRRFAAETDSDSEADRGYGLGRRASRGVNGRRYPMEASSGWN